MKFQITDDDYYLMKDFPSMNYRYDGTNGDVYIYILPPIVYPNGKQYIKLGHTVNHPEEELEKKLRTLEEVKEWYCLEDHPRAREHFTKYFSRMFPTVTPLSTELDHCVLALTATGKQYIGFVDKNMMVAAGGNGASAKMGLEIGRICARSIIEGHWSHDFKEEEFKIVYKM